MKEAIAPFQDSSRTVPESFLFWGISGLRNPRARTTLRANEGQACFGPTRKCIRDTGKEGTKRHYRHVCLKC